MHHAPSHLALRRALHLVAPGTSRRRLLGLAVAACLLTACSGAPPGEAEAAAAAGGAGGCPAQTPAAERLPNVESRHLTPDYWVGRAAQYGDVDAAVLTAEEIRAHAAALRSADEGRPLGQVDLMAPVDAESLGRELVERFGFLRERFENGTFVEADGGPVDASFVSARAAADLPPIRAELRVTLAPVALRCAPRQQGYYTASRDLAFDRNSCSTTRPQEPLLILARYPRGMRLARTRYAIGFIDDDAALSPVLGDADARLFTQGPFATLNAPLQTGSGDPIPAHTRVPMSAGGQVRVATGSTPRWVRAAATPTARPMTRRHVLEEAFALVHTPYGWGGRGGGRDCSRFLLDVFETFGLPLPRHSLRQAQAGSFSVDVSAIDNERERLALIEEAAHQGVVLLHFPGHIMLYLGQTETGTPMAIHAFSEYVQPCPPGASAASSDDATEGSERERTETLMRVDRVTVSDLSLGDGSSRGSFIERITKVIVFGRAPGHGLRGAAERRPAAPVRVPDLEVCDDTEAVAVFHSPRRAHVGGPLRVFATASEDQGPVALTLVDPLGERHVPEQHTIGGPPFTYWVEIDQPMVGVWRAVLGDGGRVCTCETIEVRERGGGRRRHDDGDAAWRAGWRWAEDTENLYAAFVEQLFTPPQGPDGVVDETSTWPNLTVLLRDRRRNILHDHLGAGEDDRIRLRPDCADLPYFLRGYFAWKMRLPFGFRRCNRGSAGSPPQCDTTLQNNYDPVQGSDNIDAFQQFSRAIAGSVHSASARTHPDSSATDVYPVALTREALLPGTVFADPYGHLLIIARFIPQTMTEYGVLVGADAQPDGTVGLRRFWRGSFLFTPSTTDAGAGFKAWRPVRGNSRRFRALPNESLTEGPRAFSRQQYEGSADDFYDGVESLINPRPLDPTALLGALVDALDESVARRIVSVNNGEEWVRNHPRETIEMPEGYAIFETSGAWEDYSTPSRDMRLLISLDAVSGFPDAVARQPRRFSLRPDEVDAAVASLRARLAELLAARSFEYTRSDGSVQRLTLADMVERAARFEMAYHPNDCPEIRWGAAPDSAEMSTCRRHAPAAHRARMRAYRPWFANRTRPPRE